MVNTGSKSWKLTIVMILVPVIMAALQALGIQGISIELIQSFVFLALGISTAGVVNAAHKRKTKKIPTHREIESFSGDSWYDVPEFKKSSTHGNVVEQGTQYLTVSSSKVRTYITVQLRDVNNNVLMIDQGSAGQSCRLRLADKLGKDLPNGNYTLIVRGDYGSSDAVGVTDRFSII